MTPNKAELEIWPQRPRYFAAAVAVHYTGWWEVFHIVAREGGGVSLGGREFDFGPCLIEVQWGKKPKVWSLVKHLLLCSNTAELLRAFFKGCEVIRRCSDRS